MIKRGDLKKIARIRLREVKALYKSGLFDGAAYLCGYVVEASLKAMICKNLKISKYPDEGEVRHIFTSHDFDRLLLLAGLQKEISLRKDKNLFTNWSLLTKWKPEKRYKIGIYKKEDVKDLLKALEEKRSGFFTWIKKIW